MDLSLPGLDGWEATRILKAAPETKGSLIIALTGHGEAQFVAKANAEGCDLFLVKPCSPQALFAEVEKCPR